MDQLYHALPTAGIENHEIVICKKTIFPQKNVYPCSISSVCKNMIINIKTNTVRKICF